MNIKKGDKIKVTDKDAIYLGFDLTNGKEYKVEAVLPGDAIVVLDDDKDPMLITSDEIENAIELVGAEKESNDFDKELGQLLDKLLEQIKEFINADLFFGERKRDEEKRKRDEIKIDMRNLPRKTIIEDAKKFVEKHIEPNCSVKGKPAIVYNLFFGVNPEFHINEEKRIITLLLRGAGDGEIMGKEIVRCAPTDVFNVHIGKAIALGRALGLDVKKFTHAAQPREVVVGQVFKVSSRGVVYGKTGTITKMKPNLDGIFGTAFSHTIDDGWLGSEQVTITDDTEAKYE